MAKNEKDEVDKISKKIIIWLIIISLSVFFFPFIGTLINHCIGLNIGELYTFGIADRKDFFTVWIALFGAIGIAINIYQNHRRTTNQDKQLIKQTEQIELQSKSQRDSRFSKGVELLGNANESARTGAAYSLYFLAKDYPEEFAKPVFEILCSHIRTITTTEEYQKNNNERPSNEIQSILDLLFRNDQSKLIFNGLIADLNYSYLLGAKLLRANLSRANLLYANLSYADLSKANLSYASLSWADLSYAYLYDADLSKTHSLKTVFFKTFFSVEMNLDGVDMSQIDLTKIRGKINPKYLTNADSQ